MQRLKCLLGFHKTKEVKLDCNTVFRTCEHCKKMWLVIDKRKNIPKGR